MNIASLLATKGDMVVTARAETDRSGTRSDCWPATTSARWSWSTTVTCPSASCRSATWCARRPGTSELFSRTVSAIMTRDVIVGTPQDDLLTVGMTMTDRRIRHLPVVDKGRLVGIVSIGDVVKAERDRYRGRSTPSRS